MATQLALPKLSDVRRLNSSNTTTSYWHFKHLKTTIVALTLLGFVAPLKFAAQLGIDIHQIASLDTYFGAVQSANSLIRQGEVEEDIFTKIFTVFPLAAIAITGVYIGLGRPLRLITIKQCLAPLLPCIALTAVTTVRNATIVPIIILASSILAGLTASRRERVLFKVQALAIVGGTVGLIAVLVIFFQSIRLGDFSFSQTGETLDHLRPWIAGYLPALGYWSAHVYPLTEPTYGTSTLPGLNIIMKTQSFSEGAIASQMPLGHGQYSNAMTYLNGFISDFGFSGAILATFGWGCLAGAVSSIARKGNLAAAAAFSGILSLIIWSPNSWFFAYGSRITASVAAFGYFLVFSTRRSGTFGRIGRRQQVRA